jgi:hypothetical protein
MDQMQFEQWIVGQRKIRYLAERIKMLENNTA